MVRLSMNPPSIYLVLQAVFVPSAADCYRVRLFTVREHHQRGCVHLRALISKCVCVCVCVCVCQRPNTCKPYLPGCCPIHDNSVELPWLS